MKVKIVELQKQMYSAFIGSRFSRSEVHQIVDVLLYAEMVGKNTQGLIKFLGNEPIQNIVPLHAPKVIKKTAVSAFIDGGKNPGMLVAAVATKLAIEICKKNKIAIIGMKNTYASTGVLGYYANEIAKTQRIGIIMSGTQKAVAPYGSIDKLLGINPVAFGFPSMNNPLIFDTATAAMTWYGLVRAKILKQNIPPGIALDNDGNPTLDPNKAMMGVILTHGDNRKISGFSLMIEILTGPLVGVVFPDIDGKWYSGNLIIAIDPDIFVGRKEFRKNTSLLIQQIKKSRHNRMIKEVVVPGERSFRLWKSANTNGMVEIEDVVYRDFLKAVEQKVKST